MPTRVGREEAPDGWPGRTARVPAREERREPRRPSRAGATRRSRPGRLALLLEERVWHAQPAHLGRLVRLSGAAAEREQAHALGPGPDLSLHARADAHHSVGVERVALALDLDLASAAERQVDLFLAVLAVVVLGVLVEVRRQVHHLHAPRLDPELRACALEGAAVDGLHLVDPLDGEIPHRSSSRAGCQTDSMYVPLQLTAARPIRSVRFERRPSLTSSLAGRQR